VVRLIGIVLSILAVLSSIILVIVPWQPGGSIHWWGTSCATATIVDASEI
jgi:hypothetical protein